MDEGRELEWLMALIRLFVKERDWEQYHRPTALAISAAIEVGELLELFQWISDDDVQDLLSNDDYRTSLSHEIADVLIYILRLADVTGINPAQAIIEKMKLNEKKYPAKKWSGKIPDKSAK